MRPTYTLSTGQHLREITIWKAIVFGLLTFGIYYLVLVYQNTRDIQQTRSDPFDAWPVFFWIGAIPFLGFLHWVLYAFNWVGLRDLRKARGLPDDSLGLVALILAILVAPVGQIIWAVHYNETIRLLGEASSGPSPPAVH